MLSFGAVDGTLRSNRPLLALRAAFGLLSLPGRAKRSTGPFCSPGFKSRTALLNKRHPFGMSLTWCG